MIMIDIRRIPFTYPWILKTAIGNATTVLDIGCGTGELMKMLAKDQGWYVIGVDAYGPSLKKARQTRVYKKLYKANISKLSKEITKKKYDVVFCSQVVEHLAKKDALALLKQMEKMARKRVVVSTTVGFMHFLPLQEIHGHEHDNNPYQKHQSSWSQKEFKKLGFVCRGQGLFLIYGEGFLAHTLPKVIHPILYAISLLFSPVVYFFPSFATYQINYKSI